MLARAEQEIIRRHPGVRIVGRHHGYFGAEGEEDVVDEVAAAAPDILFVALETPAKELFLARNRERLAVPFVMGVGGSFDVLAGERRRAPRWMRRTGLEWLYRLSQDPERVAGIDLMEALLDVSRTRGYGVFLLGARAEVLERAEREILRRHPGVRIVGRHHGYFGPEGEAEVVDEVAAAVPDILFVALETPAKELFLARNRDRLAVPFVMGVGGSFDVLAGERRRAPRWMRRTGLEWLYRLSQDPRRLARRYMVGNSAFIWLVLKDAVRIRLRPRAAGRP